MIELGTDHIWVLNKPENSKDLPQMLVDLRLVANNLKCIVKKTENGDEMIIDGTQIPDQNLNLVDNIQIWLHSEGKQVREIIKL